MDATALAAALQEAVPGAALEAAPTIDPQQTLSVPAEHLKVIATTLRDRPELRFTVLLDVIGVDYWPREPRFEVVYLLVSVQHRLRLRLKVRLGGTAARLATVSDVWPSANWLEREVWDMFGIEFAGHPDPRRLLMPEDWDGYPLRKDYPVQIQMTPQSSAPLQVTEAQFRASVERDRLTRR
jgi:NADH-quinone oxidoreductase subunit C